MKYYPSTEKATGLLPINECFAVSKTANLEVTIKPGGVMINGITAFEDNETKLTISPADSLDRIDTVVVRLLDNIPHEEVDVISGDIPSSMGDALKYKQSAYKSRAFEIAVVKGTPSETPKAPELRRDDRVYELGVANVHISGVSISEVTDTRYDDTRCGLADSIVSELLNRAGGSGGSSGYKTAVVRFNTTNQSAIAIQAKKSLNSNELPVAIDDTLFTTTVNNEYDSVILKNTLPDNYKIRGITVIPHITRDMCVYKIHPEVPVSVPSAMQPYLMTNTTLMQLTNLSVCANDDGTFFLYGFNSTSNVISITGGTKRPVYAIVYYE